MFLSSVLAEVADDEIEPALDLPISVLRQADRARLGDAFETRGDIDAVAHQVPVALFNHVAKMDANAEVDAPLGRQASVPLGEAMLQFDCTTHGVNDAAKFNDGAVTRALDHPAAVDRDRRFDEVAPERAQTRQNSIFVGAREPREPDDIHYENRCQLARFSHSWPSASDDAYIGSQPRLSRIWASGRRGVRVVAPRRGFAVSPKAVRRKCCRSRTARDLTPAAPRAKVSRRT